MKLATICSVLLFGGFLSPACRGEPITALAFSPDGSILLSNGSKQIEYRSIQDGSFQKACPCQLAKITSLAFHPRGHMLAVAGGIPGVSGETLLLDWPGEKLLGRLTNQTDLASCAAFSPDGTLLAVASADHSSRVWRIPSHVSKIEEAFVLTGHSGPVRSIAFSPDGRLMVTCSADRSIKVWSAEDGKLVRTMSYHTEAVHALAFRPQTSAGLGVAFCASAGDDRTVRVWQPGIGRMVRIVREHRGPIFSLVFSADGQALYSAGKEGIVRRIDAESDQLLGQWRAHEDWIYALALHPNGARLATGDWSGQVKVWDLER